MIIFASTAMAGVVDPYQLFSNPEKRVSSVPFHDNSSLLNSISSAKAIMETTATRLQSDVVQDYIAAVSMAAALCIALTIPTETLIQADVLRK